MKNNTEKSDAFWSTWFNFMIWTKLFIFFSSLFIILFPKKGNMEIKKT